MTISLTERIPKQGDENMELLHYLSQEGLAIRRYYRKGICEKDNPEFQTIQKGNKKPLSEIWEIKENSQIIKKRILKLTIIAYVLEIYAIKNNLCTFWNV